MAKTTAEIEKFIELRAKGYSFDRIAEEINTSKPTLLKWSSEYNKELEEQQYFELQNLLSQYGLMRKSRVEGVSVLLQGVMEELKKRANKEQLAGLSTDKLFSLFLSLEGRLEHEIQGRKLEFSETKEWERRYTSIAEVD